MWREHKTLLFIPIFYSELDNKMQKAAEKWFDLGFLESDKCFGSAS